MTWSKFFKAQNYNQPIFKHKYLPIYVTKEFDFFRCVEFRKEFYGVLATDLFKGNLRESSGRYSALFPNQKISYWSNNEITARAEVRSHGAGSNLLTFWAYDDASSFEPCLGGDEMLYVIDGRRCGIQALIEKIDIGIELTSEEKNFMERILKEPIDCIAYDSKAYPGGENFIFLEKGFRKLALREIRLRFGRKDGGSHNCICCAFSSDYVPSLKSYGEYFAPKCKIKMELDYVNSEEYIRRLNNINRALNIKFNGNKKNK